MAYDKCKIDCDKRRVLPLILRQLEEGFKRLVEADSSESLLRKHLTRRIFEHLMTKKTSFDSTLLDCVQSGFQHLDSNVGIFACDPDAYTLYSDVFNPIIEDCHGDFKVIHKHPPCDWGNSTSLNLEPSDGRVMSTKITCRRCLEGYPFSPCMSEDQYGEIERKVAGALKELYYELKGRYYPLSNMSEEDQKKFKDEHLLFEKPNKILQSANCCRFWPTGRGIFFNYEKTFMVWVNRDDHLYLISEQPDGDLGRAITRLINCLSSMEKRFNFATNKHLGFLTLCPTNLGTTIELSAHVRIPKLDEDKYQLDSIVEKHNLDISGVCLKHSEADIGIYEVSIKGKLGVAEYALAKQFYDGVREIVETEAELSIEDDTSNKMACFSLDNTEESVKILHSTVVQQSAER